MQDLPLRLPAYSIFPRPERDPEPLSLIDVAEVASKLYDALWEARDRLQGGCVPLKVKSTLRELEAFGVTVGMLEEAAWILAGGEPLADEFPDGSPAPEALTPKQTAYLWNLAAKADGRIPQAVQCGGRTKVGDRCLRKGRPNVGDEFYCKPHRQGATVAVEVPPEFASEDLAADEQAANDGNARAGQVVDFAEVAQRLRAADPVPPQRDARAWRPVDPTT